MGLETAWGTDFDTPRRFQLLQRGPIMRSSLRRSVLSLLAILASSIPTLAIPFVQGFTPNVGPPGTLVTLTGSGFRPTAALPIVQFGTIAASLISATANTIVAVVPEGATIGPITVTAMPIGNGQYTTPGYFYLPPRVTDFGTRMIGGPTIEFEKPVVASPGATLTIVGANFYVPNFPRLLVRVGEIPVTATVTADSQIQASLPQWIESGHVSVHTEVGGTTNLQQLVYVPPLISRFTATAMGGDTIEVHGYNFRTKDAKELELRIGGAKATVDVLSNTNLTAVVPNASINGPLELRVPGGAFITPAHIVIRPRITGFTPETGAAGTVMKIDGSGFNGTTRIDFGSLPAAAVKIVNSMQAEATVPPGVQTAALTLVTTNGTAVSTALFYGTPRADSFSPASGRPGTQVVLAGLNLSGATGLTLSGLSLTGFEVVDNRQIRFEIPAGATSGRVRVTTPGGSATSETTFVVRGPEPTVTGMSPGEGGSGTTVTLLGSNLAAVTNVTFNGVRASFTATSATTLETIVPSSATTGLVRVSSPDGVADSPKAFIVGTSADVRVTLSASPNPAVAYGGVLFNLQAFNNGPLTAKDTALEFVIPEGMTLIETTGAITPSVVGQKLTWQRGAFGPNDVFLAGVRVGVTTPMGAVALATITASTPDANPGNNSARVTVTVSWPRLELEVLDPTQIALSWPSAARTRYQLGRAPHLGEPFAPVTETPEDDGNRLLLIRPTNGSSELFQLRLVSP
ncbi:MAG: hypothetical protein FJ379_11130 [Verrucomicrobia bacterium]|nr:hypothetical protein [Verrucomicrobiota bacterium]